MQSLSTRLASFSAVSRPKNRAKPGFALDPSTHPHLTPSNLAAAGFFHDPSGSTAGASDTCRCFLCGVRLGGWDEQDDPFEEHAKRGGCAWADMVCKTKVERRRAETEGTEWSHIYPNAESLPSSAESAAVREQTYGRWWPHRPKSGWLPSVRNLAKAGFVYIPTEESKDLVECPFCQYQVEGWEAADDPWAIHYTKNADCRFFVARVESAEEEVKKVIRHHVKACCELIQGKAPARSTKAGGSKRTQRATTVVTLEAEARLEPETAIEAETIDADEQAAESQMDSSVKGKRGRKPQATSALKPRGGRGKKQATKATSAENPEPEISAEEMPGSQVISEVPLPAAEEEETSQTEGTKSQGGRGKGKAKPRATKARNKKAAPDPEDEVDQAEHPAPERHVAASPLPPLKTTKPESISRSTSSRPQKAVKPPPPPQLMPLAEPLHPLSSLDAFANIPPSSPLAPRPVRPLKSTNRPSPRATLPRETFDRSIQRGAMEARRVVEELIHSPVLSCAVVTEPGRTKGSEVQAGSGAEAGSETRAEGGTQEVAEVEGREGKVPFTAEQEGMTLENLVKDEFKRRYDEMQRQGREMIGRWEETTRENRKRIEAM